MSDTSKPTAMNVTLDLTDHDVYAVLVNALREAALEAADNAERAGDEDEGPNPVYIHGQERAAQIARDLVESIETQIDAHSATTLNERA